MQRGVQRWMIGMVVQCMVLGMCGLDASAQWTRHDLPQLAGSEFTRLVEHQGLVYGATTGGRVFRTPADALDLADWGQGLPPTPINELYVHAGVAYAATDDGLYRRALDGEAWIMIDRSDTLRGLTSMSSRGDTLLVLALAQGVLWTTDQGRTWGRFPAPDSIGTIEDMDAHIGDVYVAANRGVYRTTDGGLSYEDLTRDTSINEAALVHVADDGTILIGVSISGGGTINAITSDGGRTWSPLGVLTERTLRRPGIDDRFGTIVIVSFNEAAYRSIDRGRYWELIDAGFDPLDIDLQVVCIGNGIVYASARNNEIWTRPASHVLVSTDDALHPTTPWHVTRTDRGFLIRCQGAVSDGARRADVFDVLGRLTSSHRLHDGLNIIEADHPSFVRVRP